jgi:hypothetical protein
MGNIKGGTKPTHFARTQNPPNHPSAHSSPTPSVGLHPPIPRDRVFDSIEYFILFQTLSVEHGVLCFFLRVVYLY